MTSIPSSAKLMAKEKRHQKGEVKEETLAFFPDIRKSTLGNAAVDNLMKRCGDLKLESFYLFV